ncbi:hypothetical protein [Bdellovibrio sp. NC01]|uniref:hypothetical protein n=1 Tax=Bdellovibrio sp. NC01 TaxID=2220073 RepID=UPI0011589776|nr:hypothetical protein [Bdellovibrio sp. NC01]QDK37618.1 hypothetical protein DOE51_08490 [Bdellovibrio sp. NC01]
MNKLVSTVTALALTFSSLTMAHAQNCDREALARMSRAYKMQASDAQMIADNFKDMNTDAVKWNNRSLITMVSSLALLFTAEYLLVGEGSVGVVGKAGAAHSNAVEGVAEFVAARIQNQFLGAALVAASPAVTIPPVNSIAASVIINMRNSESKAQENIHNEQKVLVTMSEEAIKQRIEVLRAQQSALIEQAPNQFLDGLSLGALDNAWTLSLYENSQRLADLNNQLYALKTTELLQCR